MKLKSFVFFVFVTSCLIIIAIVVPRLIKIEKVVCESQYGQCDQEITNRLEKVRGFSIPLSRKKIKEILFDSSLVKDYQLQFKLPSTYLVNIIEKKAKFALVTKDNSGVAIVDKEGEVIALANSTNLPFVFSDRETPNRGEKIDSKILFALEIINDIFFLYQVQYGQLRDSSLLIELDRNTEVIFPLEGDRRVLLGSLNLILNKLNSGQIGSKIGDRGFYRKTIDLRFRNPIIR